MAPVIGVFKLLSAVILAASAAIWAFCSCFTPHKFSPSVPISAVVAVGINFPATFMASLRLVMGVAGKKYLFGKYLSKIKVCAKDRTSESGASIPSLTKKRVLTQFLASARLVKESMSSLVIAAA